MDKGQDTFEFLGRFPIHTYPAPSLAPQTTLDACFQNFFPSLLLKDRVLICRNAIKRSILAQYIIPYFKADISLFPKGDRLTQLPIPHLTHFHYMQPYISSPWVTTQVCLFKVAPQAIMITSGRAESLNVKKKNHQNICSICSHLLTQQLVNDKVQDRNKTVLTMSE